MESGGALPPAKCGARRGSLPCFGKALKCCLRRFGKRDCGVVAVFGLTPAGCHQAVLHLRKGAAGFPVWLFTTATPLRETAALCDRVFVERQPLRLFLKAERLLWPRWVALGVATWTGERGRSILKLAPFLIPPFRALVLNRNGDFFPGKPGPLWAHCRRWLRDLAHSGWHRARDNGRGCWLLVSYHLWRSGPCRRMGDVARALALLLVSSLLRCFAYPGRSLFPRLHGRQPLLLPPVPVSGDGVVHFAQTDPRWDGPRLNALACMSDARWILWGEQPAAGIVGDMLPLFDDECTFAVAPQAHFRGWKPMLFPMAPFRILQKGEASQVLAPVSRTILVDRRKLLALGIPRCSLAGTAWMLLFWKAAAAGWRSYCIGHGGNIRQQPDFPMQETAFVSHILFDPDLRRLSPRDVELSRGNIAFPLCDSR